MDLKMVVKEELKKGWEATSQLRSLLSQPDQLISEGETSQFNDETKMVCMKNYSTAIVNSFDTSISILNKIVRSMEMDASFVQQTSQQPKTRLRTIDTPNLTPDGYIWRKYGKKSILNTNHPREYYRCAYTEDQNCHATKQVQKISDNLTNYRITYYAEHTCQPHLYNNNNANCTNFISFKSKNPTIHPKQEILDYNVALNASSSMATIDYPASKPVDSVTIMEPLLADEIVCLNHDVLFSPRLFTSPNYLSSSNLEAGDYSLMADDSLDMSAVLMDLPLWD
ncbi:probable WRKY transcription factor 70 [Chenopodium quinoa]|uniref:probable WRKY transcription factor 70 n=1 Tax=Chenopodium quinoa TaxID=63459 RepID=UPI000B76B94E|nr:probable WRKY transcription factor 70 [Chenopodium quinoa]